MNYVIITPVFNEEKYLDVYIKSIINQSSKPLEMVMVDDSSTDDSANIIKEYSSNHTWIKYVHHSSLASKQQGSKVVAAFRHGVLSLSNLDYNVISKIDADLELPPNYFKTIMNAFQEDRQLGIVGGQIMEFSDGKWIVIPQSYYEVRGALKSYSAECYRAMGGIKPYLGWDGLDIMTAWHQGWKTKYLKNKYTRGQKMKIKPIDINNVSYANYREWLTSLAEIKKRLEDRQNKRLQVSQTIRKQRET